MFGVREVIIEMSKMTDVYIFKPEYHSYEMFSVKEHEQYIYTKNYYLG